MSLENYRKRKRDEGCDDSIHETKIMKKVRYVVFNEESKKKLYDDQGYSYHTNTTYTKNGKQIGQYWRCSNCRTKHCKSRVFEHYGTSNFHEMKEHSHEATYDWLVLPTANMMRKSSMSETRLAEVLTAKIANIFGTPPTLMVNDVLKIICSRKKENVTRKPSIAHSFFNPPIYPQLVVKYLMDCDEVSSLLVTSTPYIELLSKTIYLQVGLSTKSNCKPFQAVLVFDSFCRNWDKNLVKINLASIFLSFINHNILQQTLQKFRAVLPNFNKNLHIVIQTDTVLLSIMKEIYPENELKCDPFHWRNTIDKSIENCAVDKDLPVIKKLRCLNLIPSHDIPVAYILLKRELKQYRNDSNYKNMKTLFANIKDNWINSESWHPVNWTVFGNIYDESFPDFYPEDEDVIGILEKFNNTVAKIGELYAVDDLDAIKKNLKSDEIVKLRKYWKKYNKKKYTLDKLLKKLSNITFHTKN